MILPAVALAPSVKNLLGAVYGYGLLGDSYVSSEMRAPTYHMRSDGRSLPLAVAVSIAGMLVHTVVEFGPYSVWSLRTGFLLYSVLQIALLLWWLQRPTRAAVLALFATALLQLVGGAILSVLPLPILPFEPEQSVRHYAAHVVLGVAQAPLLVASWKARFQA